MSIRRRASRSDGEHTRIRILEVAARLFAQHGYAATASKLICEEAGADLAAINYHFGSREELYKVVLIEGHQQLIDVEVLARIARSAEPAQTKLDVFIDTLVGRVLDEQSWQSKVCAREILSPTVHFSSLIQEEVMPKFRLLEAIISQITGFAPGDPALARCVISIIAPCLMLAVIDRQQASPLQAVLQHDAHALKTHLKLFARSGLASIAP
ncbi:MULTISPECIES: TetR/AcrR family transcriptional regulator [Pseudomonas]|uniref:TetR/AcrR family transcriptional regulator n=1 Tax=Pseudomonas TaxID=286 RepID=UPI0003B5385D|nr:MULTISPECIES: CerR family C-terminal domain-containing protein [Pseudomonas]AZC18115.1 Transcriptional regulator YbiH, TetR family [Pseudomonas sp. CMR5c]ERO60216.1 transcriptional regulator [Pseudomonas piscis]ERO60338.1 transcriptional regulator [Pseudomonas piscis]MCU7646195.1 CerR family C-terminal domain-containing protein [Pseudomonas piscis]